MEEHVTPIDDLKKIKDLYGEKMAHKCRDLFPTILEQPGELSKIMCSSFAPSRFLYDDLEKFKNFDQFKEFIYNVFDNKEVVVPTTTKTPAELLKEAGYTLYECHTEEDIQKFKKYYAPGEALCTFKGDRLKQCYVFFAVKDNVDEIKREDFPSPEREDEYGTSVISIQFTRDKYNVLSIKNRYNHKVNNPDATFSNNLENIKEGLSYAFNKEYGLNSSPSKSRCSFPNYVRARDGRYYRYNFEINNIYYCPNNIIIDHFEAKHFDKEKYIVMDYFILDLQKESRGIYLYDKTIQDAFPEVLSCIKSIDISFDKENGSKTITINKDSKIVLNKYNQIKEFYDPTVENIGNDFLANSSLIKFDIPNVKSIGDRFLLSSSAIDMPTLHLSKVEKIGDSFLYRSKVSNIDLPEVEEIGDEFLRGGGKTFNLPKVRKIGDGFLQFESKVSKLSLPNAVTIGNGFMQYTTDIESLYLPNVEKIGNNFIEFNEKLVSIDFPNVKKIGNNFMHHNIILSSINLPKVQKIGDLFLTDNKGLEELSLPQVTSVGKLFLSLNHSISKLDLPSIRDVGEDFLLCNDSLKELTLPCLVSAGKGFFQHNESLYKINFPNLENMELVYSFMINKDIYSVNGKAVYNEDYRELLKRVMAENRAKEKTESEKRFS